MPAYKTFNPRRSILHRQISLQRRRIESDRQLYPGRQVEYLCPNGGFRQNVGKQIAVTMNDFAYRDLNL
ncbi:MAG: hypothetical protein KDI47_18085, partial [Gammaproteobacteria bacterium]|nr:hypothetical protein [Gammaproteobacteria bacterium]